ncbi:uncharacterized protein LOC112455593, partial [Temnothorax curvispinosus]|uniref:Uncharacterized protein LOC112455593 n=1 Tax=Temnothorax curvispinosus TaxID=300111 RepID=A0A6J1PVL2_9HYME
TVPAESTTSMNISENFLDILQLSFEIKYIDEDTGLAKKKDKLKVSEEKMNVLYHNVVDVLTDQKFDDIVALSTAHCNIGLEYVTSTDTDDLNTAVRYLSRCLELLKGKTLDRKAILTSIGALNGLNSVCEKLETEKDNEHLNTALSLYYKYTREDNYPDPIHIESLVGIKGKELNPRIILNNLHHTTLQELERQYLKRSKDKHEFVKYFLANGRFAEAKNHIAIGDYVIHRFDKDIRSEEKEAPLDSNKSYNNALAVFKNKGMNK